MRWVLLIFVAISVAVSIVKPRLNYKYPSGQDQLNLQSDVQPDSLPLPAGVPTGPNSLLQARQKNNVDDAKKINRNPKIIEPWSQKPVSEFRHLQCPAELVTLCCLGWQPLLDGENKSYCDICTLAGPRNPHV